MSCILLYLDKSGMILLILNQWSQKSDDNPFIIFQVLNYGRVITEFEHFPVIPVKTAKIAV